MSLTRNHICCAIVYFCLGASASTICWTLAQCNVWKPTHHCVDDVCQTIDGHHYLAVPTPPIYLHDVNCPCHR